MHLQLIDFEKVSFPSFRLSQFSKNIRSNQKQCATHLIIWEDWRYLYEICRRNKWRKQLSTSSLIALIKILLKAPTHNILNFGVIWIFWLFPFSVRRSSDKNCFENQLIFHIYLRTVGEATLHICLFWLKTSRHVWEIESFNEFSEFSSHNACAFDFACSNYDIGNSSPVLDTVECGHFLILIFTSSNNLFTFEKFLATKMVGTK